jgi:hypothetical protein
MRLLGAGSFREVHLVTKREGTGQMALKVSVLHPDKNSANDVVNEALMLQKIVDPFTVPFYGASFIQLDENGHSAEYPDLRLPKNLQKPNTGLALLAMESLECTLADFAEELHVMAGYLYEELLVRALDERVAIGVLACQLT